MIRNGRRGITKTAKLVFYERNSLLVHHLYIGFDDKNPNDTYYFPLSFQVDKIVDPNLDSVPLKIDKTVLRQTTSTGKIIIEEIDHIEVYDKYRLITKEIQNYHKLDKVIYKKENNKEDITNVTKDLHIVVNRLKELFEELFVLRTYTDLFIRYPNDAIKAFYEDKKTRL